MTISTNDTGYAVSDIMTKEVLTTNPEASILHCTQIMSKRNVGSLIVVDQEEKPISIITEEDVVRRVIGVGLNPEATLVKDVMVPELHTIPPDKDLYQAMVLLNNQSIKHIPVVSGGKLVGLISFKDIIKIEPDLIELLKYRADEAAEMEEV